MHFSATLLNMLNSWLVGVLLVLLQLISILNGRPQIVRPSLASEQFSYNETVVAKKSLKGSATKPVVAFGKENKTKGERILYTSNRGTVSFGQFSEQDIIFPDSFEVFYEPIPRIDGPPKCADGGTFCEHFDSYPYLHLRDSLQRQAVDKTFFFGEDEIPVELEKRISIEDDTFLCSSVIRTVYPQIAKNKDNEWKYIVNQGKAEGYVQGIRIETCRSHGEPCNIIGELPQGYRTACKQKYIYRRLLSLNEDGTFIPDTFQLPSSCCCTYKRDVEYIARSAVVNPSR